VVGYGPPLRELTTAFCSSAASIRLTGKPYAQGPFFRSFPLTYLGGVEPAQELATSRQFVNVQIPVADVRSLLLEKTGQLVRPSWPDPVADYEFVRRIGSIADLKADVWRRRPAGLLGLRGERSYCDAAKLVRLIPESGHSEFALKVVHRRLFCSGVTWRFDLGMTAWRTGEPGAVSVLAQEVLGRRFTADGAEFALADIGVRVAAALLRNTTSRDRVGALPNWWVTSGRPLVLVDEYVHRMRGIRAGVVASRVGNRNIPTLLVQHGWHPENQSRIMRRALWRAYQELETLRQVVRQWRAHPDRFSPEHLRDYLAPQLKLLSRPKRDRLDQPTLFSIVGQVDGLKSSDLLELAEELRGQSKGITRSLNAVIASLSAREHEYMPMPVTNNYLLVRGGIRVHGDSFRFQGNASGVFGSNNSVENSTFNNVNSEVSAELQNVLDALAAIEEKLTHDDRATVEEALDELQTSAGDPSRMKRALSKIAGVATLAGDVGAPVVEAVRKLLSALGIGS
jgi:hypothetical protein